MEHKHRNYRIVGLGTYPMFEIKQPGQGGVPKALEGVFTTAVEAKQAIDRYLSGLKTKGRKKNGTEASATTD